MFKLGDRDIERVHLQGVDRHFYVTGPIEFEDDYIDLVDALYQGKANETIVIHLNTPGGRLDITMQILNAMKASSADVIAIADGEVASAGTLILFAAPQIAVMPYSYVMVHDGHEGVGGKLNENLKKAQFSAKLIKKLYEEIYDLFFTKKEIAAIIDGKDMWLTSEEVNERISNAAKEADKEQQRLVEKLLKNAEEQVQE